jgi:hypothetical protein
MYAGQDSFQVEKVRNFLKGWGYNKIGQNKQRKKGIEEEIMKQKC